MPISIDSYLTYVDWPATLAEYYGDHLFACCMHCLACTRASISYNHWPVLQ